MPSLTDPRFPNSMQEPFEVTSSPTWDYNCIAWAIKKNDISYWPSPHPDHYVWPDDIPCNASLDAFIQFYEKFGYEPFDNGSNKKRYIKIAIFVKDDETKHAARQTPNGRWTSKLGPSVDVEHTLDAMEGGVYGDVAQFMRKEISVFKRALQSIT